MKAALRWVSLVMIAMWLGAAILVVASVAPAAFAVLPTRTDAGALVGRILPIVFISGAIVAIPAMLLFSGERFLRFIPSGILFASCVAAQFGVAPRIARLRSEIGVAVESLPADDPRRVRFGTLHRDSVAYLGSAMICGAVTLGLLIAAAKPRSQHTT
jgi:hypothetical protein